MSEAGINRRWRRVGSLALRIACVLLVIVAAGVGALFLFVPSESRCLPLGQPSDAVL